ncbi:MAG: Molybdopterin molybdotransferase [Hydrocarboniphaga sp.]|uniref:molybdopterin molybdotransferase MoeA n=1 Tax=Hydrocarboniphaga sp. TaxID=2033016 RepID=UPI00261E62CF|nr:gephyrin-like molybdotransferase Glp [Hydrocarboniphaga sp.]MDB5969774.1 Molybdopterin molybdotransferase [Hydrocarboniphaga sp.]
MIPVDEALSIALAAVPAPQAEERALADALGRVLAASAISTLDLPPFDQSAVDGYAVRHADIAQAPLDLPVSQTIAAAARAGTPVLQAGTAARIFTGGWLPTSADVSVRQELTQRDGDRVRILQALAAGTDIRRQGEELRRGDTIGSAGARITPGLLGAIAMGGVCAVQVYRQPRIAVLVTGDEVAPPGAVLKPGQIADANGPLLQAHLQHWGYTQVRLRYVDDRYDSVCVALAKAFAEADIVLTTGGVSVGDHDHVPAAAQACGATTLFWKVAQKPGMPLYVASTGRSQLFGLPGNPASVLVNLLVYVRPALARFEGVQTLPAWRRGRLATDVRAETAKTLWLRMREATDDGGQSMLRPLGKQASHMLSNLAEASVLVRIPAAADGRCSAGAIVEWSPL